MPAPKYWRDISLANTHSYFYDTYRFSTQQILRRRHGHMRRWSWELILDDADTLTFRRAW